MICVKTVEKTSDLAVYTSMVCGKEIRYAIRQLDYKCYGIDISDGETEASEKFFGDFISVAELFSKIVKTDTLPDNLKYIAEDYNC